MHILWAANFSSQSGYALQSRMFAPRIQQAGHKITVFELTNGGRLPAEIGGIKVLPIGLDPLGSDMFQGHYEQSGAHCIITLVDVWGLNAHVLSNANWYPLTPIDTMPAAPAVVENLKLCKTPIAYSRYGESELRKVGFTPYYWPHAVDPTIWKPGNKAAVRQMIGVPEDIFFVSFVGVNDSVPSRKGIGELLMAWQLFSETHKDALLYMHTSINGNLGINAVGGVKIDVLIKTLGINPNTIKIVDQYRYRTGIPSSELAMVAQASDALVLPTRGEGFGLPLIEFQRAGCPVITTDFAAGSELCFSGWKIEGEPDWSWQDAIVMKPGVASICEALEAAYQDRNNPERSKRAIEGARDYDIDAVMGKYAIPVLNDIAERILSTAKVA